MFRKNNRPSFHFWCNDIFVKHEKVWKYYETHCVEKVIFLFMLLWTPIFVENSNISATIFFIFLKNLLKQTWNSFDTKFQLQGKDLRSNYQVKENFRNFCQLVIMVLGQNNVKGLKFTKCLKKNYDWRGLELEKIKKKVSRENNSQIFWG